MVGLDYILRTKYICQNDIPHSIFSNSSHPRGQDNILVFATRLTAMVLVVFLVANRKHIFGRHVVVGSIDRSIRPGPKTNKYFFRGKRKDTHIVCPIDNISLMYKPCQMKEESCLSWTSNTILFPTVPVLEHVCWEHTQQSFI